MNALTINTERKKILIEELKRYISDEMEEDIGDLKAELFFEFLKELFGKEYYNNGVLDTKKYIFERLEDLEIDIDQILIN